MNSKPINFLVPAGRRLILLLLVYALGLIIAAVAGTALGAMGGPEKATAMMRIATIVQDVFMLVLPAVVTAVIVTRNPAGLLAIDRLPSLHMLLLAVGVMLVSSPAMSWIIELNNALELPQSLSGLEQAMRDMEEAANAAIELVIGPHTPANLVMSILIVGVMAGLSEELFFRGALQRMLSSSQLSAHAAVWITAAIFSLIHFQIFGFVPRMLLGAFFGYLLLWSGSVWLPVIMHTLNNSMFIILQYTTGTGDIPVSGENSWMIVVASALLTATGLYLLYRQRTGRSARSNGD